MDITKHIIRLIEINPGAFLSSLSLISMSLSYNIINNYTDLIFDVLLVTLYISLVGCHNILRGGEYLSNNYYIYFVISVIISAYFMDFTKLICLVIVTTGAIGENL